MIRNTVHARWLCTAAALVAGAMAAFPFAVAAQALGSTGEAPETRRVYLSGHGPEDAVPWQFTIDKGPHAGEVTEIKVPSNWQQQGFGHYQYGYDRGPRSDDHAVYRRSFDVPAEWAGKSIRLVFDGVMTDTLVKVNGTLAGPRHQGGFNRFGFEIGTLLKPGRRNAVEVVVSEASAAKDTDIAERWGDYWAFSGIFRPVWLEVAPAEAIGHLAVDARANGDITVDAALAQVRTATRLTAQVFAKDGSKVGTPFTAAIPAGGAGAARLSGHVDAPRLWTAETPNLYDVDVTLWSGETAVHRMRTRFGFRTFEIRAGNGLYVNGQRVLLKGINRHSFRPDTGRTLSRKDAYADVALLRGLNMNAVRLSHYSPEESFLEAADELGLYVIDELTGWQHAHDTEVGRKLVRELVERDVNHPSILLWTNGNEGGWNRALDGDFALYDPQKRPVLHPWELFDDVDTKHYPRYGDLQRRLSGTSLVMPTEFLHALYDGGGGSGLDDYWRAISGSPRGAGAFIWNLADEGIARRDQGGTIDTAATLAPDGIIGPRGEPEPSYYTVRDIWSPVQIADPALGAGFDGRLRVTNTYDFTSLDGISFDWRWLRFPAATDRRGRVRTLASGTAKAAGITPHGNGIVTLSLPPRHTSADALAVTVREGGSVLLDRVWSTNSNATGASQARTGASQARTGASQARTGAPQVVRRAGSVQLVAGAVRADIDASTGLLTSLRRGDGVALLGAGPRLVFARPVANKMEPTFAATIAVGDGSYRPAGPVMANVIEVETGMTAEDGWGGFTLQVSPDGQSWNTVFTGARTARDGIRYPFAPQRVTAVRAVDCTGVRKLPVIRTVRVGAENYRFPDPVVPKLAAVTSGTGRDPVTGKAFAWVEAPGAGGLARVRWTLDVAGTLSLDYAYSLTGPMLYHGVGFDEGAPLSVATALVKGPWPVWQNRLRGPQLGIHRIAAMDTAGLPAPADAGYFADPHWVRLDGKSGTLIVRNEGSSPFLQLGMRRADLPSTSVDFPHSAVGFLGAIPAMGAKFQAADTTGPQGEPSVATGDYKGRLLFDLMPARKGTP